MSYLCFLLIALITVVSAQPLVTGDETPLVVNIPRDLTCTAVNIDVSRIEWRIVIAGFEPILSFAENVNELTIQPLPFQSGDQTYKCVVISTSGERYSEDAIITIEGIQSLVLLFYHVDTIFQQFLCTVSR
jgi:hypothetical protein